MTQTDPRSQALTLLPELCDAHGASGSEGPVRDIVRRELGTHPLASDGMGGVVCSLPSSSPGPRVVITAHMDEVGFAVQQITEEGFLRFVPLGGWWTHNLLTHRLRIRTRRGDEHLGMVASVPPHLLTPEKRDKVQRIEDLAIDVGATSREEVEEGFGIQLGDPIVPEAPFRVMSNPDHLLAKAFDNRVGVGLMIQALQRLGRESTPNALLGVATVQEELGIRGARVAARVAKPDVALVLEGPPADDGPGFRRAEAQGRLGGGVQIRLMDPSAVMNRELVAFVQDVARANGIPHQLTVRRSGGTDAAQFQYAETGTPVVVLGVPARYIHAPNGILHIGDYLAALELIVETARRLDEAAVRSLTEV